jgi:hypothetical protein
LSTVINGELDLLSTFSQTGPLQTVRQEQRVVSPPPNIA